MSGRPIGWERLEAEWWATIRETIAKPWPREAVLMDLRYWQGQEAATGGRVERPGRPTLIALWGWTDWQVKQAFKSEGEWSDPRRQRTTSAPPEDRQDSASAPPATDKENADNMKETASAPPASRQPAASEPPADRPARVPLHGSRSTPHGHGSPSEETLVSPEAAYAPAEAAPLQPVPPFQPEPSCVPQLQTPTSAPKQEAKIPTNGQLGLYNLGTAGTAENQKTSKKAATKVQKTAKYEDVERVWNHFRQWHPLTKQAVPKGDGEQIAICLKEWTADEIMAVFTWAHTSQHESAVWLREHDRDCVKTLTVQADFSRRLELAMREQGTKGPAPAPAQPAPQEDPAAIWDSVIKRRSTGIRIMPDDIPARVQGAIRAAGGWNQIGLLNDYTEKQAKTAFIAAYRNPPPNGHQRTA